MKLTRLKRAELPVATEELARRLIGVVLVRKSSDGRTAGRIVETEAYVLGDPASHAYIGPRERTASMFLEPFHSYVYLIYGTNFCFNVTSEARGEGAAVLIRALVPLEGIEIMQWRRQTEKLADLCRGPGRLTQAMRIDRSLDGVPLLSDRRLWLAAPPQKPGTIGVSRRIGLTRAAHRRLRFYEQGNSFISGPRSLSLS